MELNICWIPLYQNSRNPWNTDKYRLGSYTEFSLIPLNIWPFLHCIRKYGIKKKHPNSLPFLQSLFSVLPPFPISILPSNPLNPILFLLSVPLSYPSLESLSFPSLLQLLYEGGGGIPRIVVFSHANFSPV